jgi:hypothetical protein
MPISNHNSFDSLRTKDNKRIELAHPDFGREYFRTVELGDVLEFRTKITSGRGVLIEIDHGAMYPLKLDWTASNGERRVSSFAIHEFLNLAVFKAGTQGDSSIAT